jgi:hypothetical protein
MRKEQLMRKEYDFSKARVGATRLDPVGWLTEARTFRRKLKIKPLTERELRAARQAGRA